MEQEFSYKDIFNPRLFQPGEVFLPVVGSLLLHAGYWSALEYALSGRSFLDIFSKEKVVDTKQYSDSVSEISEKEQCTPNPHFKQVSPSERGFLDDLVADLQDTHLDTMPFGEFMVSSEVYVHNSEERCTEMFWGLNSELASYRVLENQILDDFVRRAEPASAVSLVFRALHDYKLPGSERSLLYEKDEHQARPLVAKYTGMYNCDSGTQWLTAVASSHPAIGDKLKLMVYDNHALSVLVDGKQEYFFENTEDDGAFYKPEIRGVVREKELFVVGYLRGRGVALEQLPAKFQEWYGVGGSMKEPAQSIIISKTNTFNVYTSVGIRPDTLEDELKEVPSGFPMPKGCSGVCAVSFDAEKYDWNMVLHTANLRKMKLIRANENHWWQIPEFYELSQKEQFASLMILSSLKEYPKYSEDPEYSKDYLERGYNLAEGFKILALKMLYDDVREGVRPVSWEYGQTVYTYIAFADFTVPQLRELLDTEIYDIVFDDLIENYRTLQQSEEGNAVIDAYIAKAWTFAEKKIPSDTLANNPYLFGIFDKKLFAYQNLWDVAMKDPAQFEPIMNRLLTSLEQDHPYYFSRMILNIFDDYLSMKEHPAIQNRLAALLNQRLKIESELFVKEYPNEQLLSTNYYRKTHELFCEYYRTGYYEHVEQSPFDYFYEEYCIKPVKYLKSSGRMDMRMRDWDLLDEQIIK